MSNYISTATSEKFIPCSVEDFERLAKAMHLTKIREEKGRRYATEERDPEGEEESFHGFVLDYDKDGVFIYSEDGSLNFDEFPDEAITIIGEILTKTTEPFIEIGFAYTADRSIPGSCGGSAVRIYANGTFAYPNITWPEQKKK